MLFAMKKAGRLRYVGVTTSEGRRHDEIEKVMRSQPIDFVQVTYNVLDREVEERILPLALERRIGVICNRPFRRGELIRARRARSPARRGPPRSTARTGRRSCLKFIVSHPAVICAIPATSRVDHVRQNVGASYGRLPDEAMRRRIVAPTSRSSDVGVVDLPPLETSCSSRPARTTGSSSSTTRRSGRRRSLALGLGLGDPVLAVARLRARRGRAIAGDPRGVLALGRGRLSRAALRERSTGPPSTSRGPSGSRRRCWSGVGVVRRGLAFDRPTGAAARAGMAMFAFALLVEPLAGPLLGRGWRQVEIFGVAPDPTAVATLGLLLAARGPGRGVLMIIPVLWCLTTGAFLAAMEAPDAWVAPAAAALAVGLAVRQTWARRRM